VITEATRLLPFNPPLDWQHLLGFIAGRMSAGVEAVEDGVYHRTLEWQGSTGSLSVSLAPQSPHLIATFRGDVARHADTLIIRISHLFDVYAQPSEIAARLSVDPWMATLVSAQPGLRVPGTFSAFELVVRTIVGQQVSVKGATTIVGRMVQRAGTRLEGSPVEHLNWLFPTPEALAQADLHKVGMPNKRIDTVQRLAAAVACGALQLEGLGGDYTRLRQQLLAMPGIGPWTVEYIAMRAWRDPDAWPGSDLVLMNVMTRQDPNLTRLALHTLRADAWKPYRAYAAMHLWNAASQLSGGANGG
jgi:DNA-3-methyladenine glycosylase II